MGSKLLKGGLAALAVAALCSSVPAFAQDGDMHRHMMHREMRHEMHREMRHHMMHRMMRHEMHREMRHRMMRHEMHREMRHHMHDSM